MTECLAACQNLTIKDIKTYNDQISESSRDGLRNLYKSLSKLKEEVNIYILSLYMISFSAAGMQLII